MNTFLNELRNETNYGFTENGEVKHLTTKSDVLDMFSLCGAFRNRSEDDCITKFKNALAEDEKLAMKCLFYLGDCRGGQGERRFFRVCFKWLAINHPKIASRNMELIPEYRRWDDLIYSCVDTPLEEKALAFIKKQIELDVTCKTPSLLAKWLPSENASSKDTKRMGNIVRAYLGLTHKQYRVLLAELRTRINIVEKLMSENRWDQIEFDKIPSKAGLIYKNAFARRDIIAKKYETFAKDKTTKVNADTLYPYEIVRKAIGSYHPSEVDRAMLDKYWENQKDVLEGKPANMLCVCDTSGSMTWGGAGTVKPIDMAIGLSMYTAERAKGAFNGYYISFSSRPQLIRIEGTDFYDKVMRIYNTNLCSDTNLEAVFDLLYKTALNSNPEDMMDTIIVISDMEINHISTGNWRNQDKVVTGMESIRAKWAAAGLKLPRLVYWNVNARNDTFLDFGPNVSFVSGSSPSIFTQIVTGKTGFQLMLEVLNSKRYEPVG